VKDLKRIDTEFYIEEIDIDVRISKHVFVPRKIGEDKGRIRGYMFKSREQYQKLLVSAVKDYNVLEFTNKGKVAFVFQYAKERYTAILAIERGENEHTLITVVTIEKIGSSHFGAKESFRAMRNKVYSKFVLPFSSIRSVENKIGTYNLYKKKFSVYKTYFFNKVAAQCDFEKNIDKERLINSMISFYETNDLATPMSRWIVFPRSLYRDAILISFEKKLVCNSSKVVIIFSGYIPNVSDFFLESLDEYSKLENFETHKGFHKLESKLPPARRKLIIKSKKNKEEQL